MAWFNYEANRLYSSDKFALGGRSQTLHLGRWKRAKSRSWWERTKDASGSYCFQFKSSGKQIRLISIFFLSQQSFSRMIAFIRLAMGMNNTHRKFLVVSTEEILCQSDRITNFVFLLYYDSLIPLPLVTVLQQLVLDQGLNWKVSR